MQLCMIHIVGKNSFDRYRMPECWEPMCKVKSHMNLEIKWKIINWRQHIKVMIIISERNLNWQWDYLHVISSTKHQSVEDMKFNFEILKSMTSANDCQDFMIQTTKRNILCTTLGWRHTVIVNENE